MFIDFRGVGGSPSNEEISTDIGSGVNGEKLGTGYENYLFVLKELSYEFEYGNECTTITSTNILDHLQTEIMVDFIQRKVVITRWVL